VLPALSVELLHGLLALLGSVTGASEHNTLSPSYPGG
jgi:hypothetical protein